MQSLIELKIFAVSEIIGNTDVAIIAMYNKEKTMQLGVLCDSLMKEELHLRLSRQKVCNTMLPEVLVNILKNQIGYTFQIVINDISDGVYRAMIISDDGHQTLSLRASDAILLHLIAHVPIYATESLMRRQAMPITGTIGVSLPYNALSDKMLQDAMQSAIELEKYEMASTLRDELKRRGKA